MVGAVVVRGGTGSTTASAGLIPASVDARDAADAPGAVVAAPDAMGAADVAGQLRLFRHRNISQSIHGVHPYTATRR